jgi:hypothetical protein
VRRFLSVSGGLDGQKHERYVDRFKRRYAELPYREVRRKNLDRLGDRVRACMGVAGDTPLPEKWEPLLQDIETAYRENPEHLVVVLWRVLCNFTVREEEKEHDRSGGPVDFLEEPGAGLTRRDS